jgi:hypothetical protein
MTEEEEANLEAENALKAVAANSLDSAAAEAEVATEEDVILSACD